LKQIGAVREYQGHFERLLSLVGRFPPSQQVGCFISGLKEHLRVDVQALKPTSLSATVGLACLYEAKCHSQQRLLPLGENEESLLLSLSTGKIIKKLTPIELNERQNKGLCFNCDEKFASGYRCKKRFYYYYYLLIYLFLLK
jgi:hypothetical protein